MTGISFLGKGKKKEKRNKKTSKNLGATGSHDRGWYKAIRFDWELSHPIERNKAGSCSMVLICLYRESHRGWLKTMRSVSHLIEHDLPCEIPKDSEAYFTGVRNRRFSGSA